MIAILGRSSGLRLCKPRKKQLVDHEGCRLGSRHGHRQCFCLANSVERPSLQGRRVPEELNPAIAWRLKARRKDSRLRSWKAASDLAASPAFPEQRELCGVSPGRFPAGFQGGFRMGSELRRVGFRDGFRTDSGWLLESHMHCLAEH